MEQLTRLAEELLTLRTAELVRRNGPHEAMASRMRGVLLNHLTAGRQGGNWQPNQLSIRQTVL